MLPIDREPEGEKRLNKMERVDGGMAGWRGWQDILVSREKREGALMHFCNTIPFLYPFTPPVLEALLPPFLKKPSTMAS